MAYPSLGHYSLSDTIIITIYTMFHPREEGEARKERKRTGKEDNGMCK